MQGLSDLPSSPQTALADCSAPNQEDLLLLTLPSPDLSLPLVACFTLYPSYACGPDSNARFIIGCRLQRRADVNTPLEPDTIGPRLLCVPEPPLCCDSIFHLLLKTALVSYLRHLICAESESEPVNLHKAMKILRQHDIRAAWCSERRCATEDL